MKMAGTWLPLLLILSLVIGQEVPHRRPHLRTRTVVINRSIVDSHPLGGNRSCGNEGLIRAWLPPTYRLHEDNKHMHLLLAVTDNQLPHLINFLAIAFTFRYLPNPRVLIHFVCHGHQSKLFVENYLGSECQPRPKRMASANETIWQRIVKDRLGSFLEIVESLDETDAGAMTFDLDSVWIRNMVPVFDTFSTNYDFIAQSTMVEQKWRGRVSTQFGGVFIKNSPAGKMLAVSAALELERPIESEYPDQEYMSRTLFNLGKATQAPLPEFAFTKSSEFSNSHCAYFPDTCTHIARGVNGTFVLGSSVGAYQLLPQLVAPTDCSHICSSSTILFQHCGISKCTPDVSVPLYAPQNSHPDGDKVDTPCSKIPEFIITHKRVHEVIRGAPPSHKFRTHHAVFDSARVVHMMASIERFVDKDRAQDMCKVYSRVCRVTTDGFVIAEE